MRVPAAHLAKLHGVFNVVGGVWPLVSMGSFEWVFGPKRDRWLVRTVAGLLVSNGGTQLFAPTSEDGLIVARRLGVGTAATLLLIDVVYVPKGELRKTYLIDAAM